MLSMEDGAKGVEGEEVGWNGEFLHFDSKYSVSTHMISQADPRHYLEGILCFLLLQEVKQGNQSG